MSLSPLLKVARLFGFMPFVIEERGIVNKISFSEKFGLYSMLLTVLGPLFTISGITTDLLTGASTMLKQPFVRNVTLVDFVTIVTSYVSGIITILLKREHFLRIVYHFTRMDNILGMKHPEKARRYTILSIVFIYCAVVLVVIVHNHMTIFVVEPPITAQFFIPYLASYFILCTVVVQHWILLDGVRRRLVMLETKLMTHNIVFLPKDPKIKMILLKNEESVRTYSRGAIQSQGQEDEQNVSRLKAKDDKMRKAVLTPSYVSALVHVYDHLFITINLYNDTFGLTIVLLMFNAIINTLVSAYYLVFELTTPDPVGVWTMEILWIVFHTLRLIMIIEAADSVNKHLASLRPRVSKLVTLNEDKPTSKQLKTFSTYLMQTSTTPFYPCSLFCLTRRIYLNVLGTILSYLVILVNRGAAEDGTDEEANAIYDYLYEN